MNTSILAEKYAHSLYHWGR